MPDLSVLDVLRLEVEADPDPGALVNLIPNPNGDMGGYGWVTPVAGARIGRHLGQLRYVNGADDNNRFHSELLPIAAGQYAAASFALTSRETVRARIAFFDANGTATGSGSVITGTKSDADPANPVAVNLPPVAAPANTTQMYLYVEIGNTDGTFPNTAPGWGFYFNRFTLAVADSPANLASTRTNLMLNPSFENNANGWRAGQGNASVTRVAGGYVGSYSLQSTQPAGTTAGSFAISPKIACTPLRTYAVQAMLNPNNNGGAFDGRLLVRFYNAAGDTIATYNSEPVDLTSNAWTQVSLVASAPADAVRMDVHPYVVAASAVPGNRSWRVDAVMVERADEVGDYFDGSTPGAGTVSYAWNDTAGNSTSKATDTNLGYVGPLPYLDILGDTATISVTREELNVGTLQATITNPALDPVTADYIRPGRKVRLTVLDPDTETWEPLIQGTVSNGHTDYQPLNPGQPAIVTLTATDNVALLANAKRPSSVATIAELPYVLEGAGVPWDCDGATGQVASANVVVTNENASALDQVALTRDTVGGYAWVDRYGVLTARTSFDPITFADAMDAPVNNRWDPTSPSVTLTDSSDPAAGHTSYARVTSSTTYTTGALPTNDLTLTPDVSYRISWQARVASLAASRWYYLLLGWVGADGSLVVASTVVNMVFTAADTWQDFSHDFTLPAGAVAVRPIFSMQDRNQANLTAADHLDLDTVAITAAPASIVLDQNVYNPNLAIDFDTDRTINSVSVHRQWTHPTEGSEETVYGPYTDAESVTTWGLHNVEITVAGTDPADIPAFAQAILDANATPTKRVNSLTIPITTELLRYALIDLYDRLSIVTDDLTHDAYPVSITHTINADPTGDRWLVDLAFAATDAVTSPTAQPPLTGAAANPLNAEKVVRVRGTGSAGSTLAQYATTDVTVSFGITFNTIPDVFVEPYSTWGGSFMPLTITTTNFTMRIVNLRNASVNPGFRWFAIGT